VCRAQGLAAACAPAASLPVSVAPAASELAASAAAAAATAPVASAHTACQASSPLLTPPRRSNAQGKMNMAPPPATPTQSLGGASHVTSSLHAQLPAAGPHQTAANALAAPLANHLLHSITPARAPLSCASTIVDASDAPNANSNPTAGVEPAATPIPLLDTPTAGASAGGCVALIYEHLLRAKLFAKLRSTALWALAAHVSTYVLLFFCFICANSDTDAIRAAFLLIACLACVFGGKVAQHFLWLPVAILSCAHSRPDAVYNAVHACVV
jgi:hypothetical protein